MTDALILLAVFVVIPLGYLGAGWFIMRARLPAIWEKQREQWGSSHWLEKYVREQVLYTIFLWPCVLIAAAYRGVVHPVIDAGDPEHREWQMRQRESDLQDRERKIAALERELGIGR